MAQSLFMTLKAAQECEIDVLAPGWSLPILARMPEVSRTLAMPLGHGELKLGVRYHLGRQLATVGYDQAIVLPGSLKSALIPAFAGIPVRTGFRGEMRYGLINDMRMLSKRRLPLTVQRFVTLGRGINKPLPDPLPRPRLRADTDNQQRLRQQFALSAELPAIAFMPGAEYGPAKQWPLPHFATLAEKLTEQGYQVWILGSEKDRAAGDIIAADMEARVHNLCGRTKLADAVDLLAMSDAAVTNDSGLMHVAAAVDTPLVALYGSSTPEHTPPLTERAMIRYLDLDCSPCFKRECPLGHTRCLTGITPASVLDALAQLGVNTNAHHPRSAVPPAPETVEQARATPADADSALSPPASPGGSAGSETAPER